MEYTSYSWLTPKTWERTFGGDEVGSVQQTSDGGYIVVGSVYSGSESSDILLPNTSDIFLIRIDASGNKIWDKTFGGIQKDWGQSVLQTSDGGFIICGATKSYGSGDMDVWLIKTDSNGNKIWDKTFGGSYDDVGYSVKQTSDGGYIIVGSTGSYGRGGDIWLIKTDTNGNLKWDKTFGGPNQEQGRSVKQTNDGGYIIAGYNNLNFSEGNAWLIKVDSLGNWEWDKIFKDIHDGLSVLQTYDGAYIVLCGTHQRQNPYWLIKVDAYGNLLWDKHLQGFPIWASQDLISQTADSRYIITGLYQFDGPSSAMLMKVDAEGNQEW